MKQTAVDWLIEQWPILESQLPSWLIDQAKAMEKEQIIEALMTSEVELLSWGISAEQYYNKTYKAEQ